MMPAVDPREDARRRRAGVVAVMTSISVVAATIVSNSRYRDWVWASWLVSFTVIIAFTTISMRQAGPPYRRGRGGDSRRRHRGRDGGLGGHARDGAESAGPTAYQWRALLVVSRMMPGSAGRRWLAEAESLLSEIAPARRGAAARSYLRSAPRLTAMMWAREVLHTVARSRRPG
jgi:hypothetical protein